MCLYYFSEICSNNIVQILPTKFDADERGEDSADGEPAAAGMSNFDNVTVCDGRFDEKPCKSPKKKTIKIAAISKRWSYIGRIYPLFCICVFFNLFVEVQSVIDLIL